nr:CGNR zinc finger domain-containing protein [Clostridioides sp.]
MPEIKEFSFENILFTYETCSCDCVIDIEHVNPGEIPRKKYKLQSIPKKKILFGYAAKKGLVRIASNGTIEETNILGSLIALSNSNNPDKDLIKFLKENGFIFPVVNSSYEHFDEYSLFLIINRLKQTVELMTATNEINKDYQKMFTLLLSLLFCKDVEIKTDSMSSKYISCHHAYIDFIGNPPTALSYQREQEEFDKDTYCIYDTLFDNYELNIQEYNDIIGGYSTVPGFNDILFKNLTHTIVTYENDDINRKISHFLFHYFHEVGMVNLNNNLEYYTAPQLDNLTPALKEAMIDIAKYIIGEEINANLGGIYPVYNAETMSPSWKVDSLLCAAYFSVFYLKPDLELYRPCDNPRCGKYFLVKTTSTKTRYCSTECCNRVTQDRYRKRKREKENN